MNALSKHSQKRKAQLVFSGIYKNIFLLSFLFSFGIYNCNVTYAQSASVAPTYIDTTNMSDEGKVKAMVENFLVAAGNYDFVTMETMFTKNANIASSSFHSGSWRSSVYAFDEWIAGAKAQTNPKPFREPVTEFTTHIDKGQLAFVKADAILYRDDIAVSNNIAYFILLKDKGVWKFVNASYVATPYEEK